MKRFKNILVVYDLDNGSDETLEKSIDLALRNNARLTLVHVANPKTEVRKTIAERTPSSRQFADPNEIAGAALFLASEDARSMYGSVMVMDEGITAGY